MKRLDDLLAAVAANKIAGVGRAECVEAVAYVSGRSSVVSELERRWYDSLSTGRPDFGVYEDPLYIAEAYACWSVYSRRYVAALARNSAFSDAIDRASVSSIADLGCGIGFSTLDLANAFPRAAVYGTNVAGCPQAAVAAYVSRGTGIEIRPLLARADLVFASEYFEHFEEPVRHLDEVLEACEPSLVVTANTFSGRACGHFESYVVGELMPVSGRKASAYFNARIRERGYRPVATNFWNNRPAVWEKR